MGLARGPFFYRRLVSFRRKFHFGTHLRQAITKGQVGIVFREQAKAFYPGIYAMFYRMIPPGGRNLRICIVELLAGSM